MKHLILAAVVVVVALVAGTFAWNFVHADGASITGCVTANGILRIIGADFRREDCRARERLLTWNTAGVPGPQGSQGEPGPVGPQGPQGPAGTGGGALNTYMVTSAIMSIGINEDQQAFAQCREGDQVLSGGYFVQGSKVRIINTLPAINARGWFVSATTFAEPPDLSGIGFIAAYALCNDLTP